MRQQQDVYRQLYNVIRKADDHTAQAIYQRIRADRSPDSVWRFVQTGSIAQPGRLHEQRLRMNFVKLLAQSTLPLRDLADVATHVLSSESRINIPQGDAYLGLRDRLISVDVLAGALKDANPDKRGLVDFGTEETHPRGLHASTESVAEPEGPIFWVPASPWTSLTANDEAVSHLVSMYLTFVNPYWHGVEHDIFLKAMRGRQRNEYCSPALVHAILAVASVGRTPLHCFVLRSKQWADMILQLNSEIEEAFRFPGQLLTRGLHYHDEAVKLWKAQSRYGTIADVSTALIMLMSCTLRGQDKVLGWEFLAEATAINKTLRDPESQADGVYALARNATASSISYYNMQAS